MRRCLMRFVLREPPAAQIEVVGTLALLDVPEPEDHPEGAVGDAVDVNITSHRLATFGSFRG